MTELESLIFTEKYRSQNFNDLICDKKELLKNYLKNNKEIPSFIFYSSSPGTGKTSCAKIISKELNCDMLSLNSSMDRGIDTIRDRIKLFAQSLSSNNNKRMVFLDEADGLTPQAMNSLRTTMEEFSDNCFFIFTVNDLFKIIEPIRSRCIVVDFNLPNKKDIFNRLEFICQEEKIKYEPEDLHNLISNLYPDIRSMVLALQSAKIDEGILLVNYDNYNKFLKALVLQDIQTIYAKAFSSEFNIKGFNEWFLRYLFKNLETYSFQSIADISILIAEIEKNYLTGVNLPILFIANMLQIAKILQKK